MSRTFEHACLRAVTPRGAVIYERNFSIFANTIEEVAAAIDDIFGLGEAALFLLKADLIDGRTEHYFWNADRREFVLL